MNKHHSFKRIAIGGLGAVLLSAGANALADPPARIARLAYVNGPVSFAPAGDNNWESASLNRPLIPGDRLWVEAGARDEVQVGGAALRMGGNTLVTLLNMDDRTTQVQLSQGRLNVRVRQLRPNDVFEIDTPNLALTIRQPGDYRIEVDPAGNATMVAVRRGQAEAYGDGNAYRLGAGQAFRFAGTDLRDVQYARPELNDEFDRWSASRDQRIERARSARYVSPDLVGYEDLDDQGSWRSVPSYGNVWMPAHVGRDWAPYRDGHWSYVQPWGWTWVDDAPWGFAVSHYGRWSRFPDGWGWVPGPRAASPVYAPALVAFISIGSGAYAQRERPVAWFPLAPREVYRPSYRASPTYITNINITNTTLIRNQIPRENHRVDYVNRRVGGAVTAVPATAFVHAQPVSRAAIAVPVAALAAAAIAHAAPVSPERDSMRGHGNPGHQPPPALMARQVLAKTAPPSQFRHAPMPAANVAQPAPQAAGPAPRVLPQDRHGAGRQLREVPAQAPVAAPGAPAVPQPNGARVDRHADSRMNGGQRGAAPAPVPGQAMPAPMSMPKPAPMPEHGRNHVQQPSPAPTPVPVPLPEHGRNRTQQPPPALTPPPMPASPAQHGPGRMQPNPPSTMPQPIAPISGPVAPGAAEGRREEMRQGREHRERSPRGMPPQARPEAQATPVAPPPPPAAPQPVQAPRHVPTRVPEMAPRQVPQPAAQRAPAPPPPAAVQRQPEPPQARHAPPPAAAPAAAARPPEPPKPEQAHAAPPAPPAVQHGRGNEGKKEDKKDDKHRKDHPEQN